MIEINLPPPAYYFSFNCNHLKNPKQQTVFHIQTQIQTQTQTKKREIKN
jgi:hypothetical protein